MLQFRFLQAALKCIALLLHGTDRFIHGQLALHGSSLELRLQIPHFTVFLQRHRLHFFGEFGFSQA